MTAFLQEAGLAQYAKAGLRGSASNRKALKAWDKQQLMAPEPIRGKDEGWTLERTPADPCAKDPSEQPVAKEWRNQYVANRGVSKLRIPQMAGFLLA